MVSELRNAARMRADTLGEPGYREQVIALEPALKVALQSLTPDCWVYAFYI